MQAESTRPTTRRARLLALVIVVLIVPLLLVLMLEGASSVVLLARVLYNPGPAYNLGGRRLTQQDSLLGWVGTPGISVPDMYGPGAGLHVDARGFRMGGKGDSLTGGSRLRAVCSGDSFTFGAGVADDRTWCALLGLRTPGLATVNMGQSGYGLDQVYLWYKRDGSNMAHDVQVFAYITDDLHRMRVTTSYGSAKPRLELRNDSLVTTNVPVPRHDAQKPWYRTRTIVRNELRLLRLSRWVRDSVFPERGVRRGNTSGTWSAQDSLTWMTVRRVVDDLVRINDAKGSILVLVHLPVFQEYWAPEADPWRQRMRANAAGGAFVFVDMVEALRRLPADSAEQMFIGFNIPGYANGFGHLSVAGNAWVAGHLHRRFREIPSLAAKLDGTQQVLPASRENARPAAAVGR